VRYNCHQALKEATGRDFGYDHLAENATERQRAVLRWRQWWGDQFQDQWFASSYAQAHGFTQGDGSSSATPSTPMTETQPPQGSSDQGVEVQSGSTQPQSQGRQGSGNNRDGN
jgi:hypothetical protein